VRRFVIWLGAAFVTVALTIIAFCPAAWMAPLVERQTGGRLTLGDPQGTLWQGSAFIGAAPGGNDPVTPLLPGRFAWRLSPMVLFGIVDLQLRNPSALTQAVRITGDWTQWQVSPAAVLLPAERLSALGAPLNTVQLSGDMRLSWTTLQVTRNGNQIDLNGVMTLEMTNIASRLSPVKPLGAYELTMEWRGQRAQVALKTVRGPMLLSGTGTIVNGRFQFSGRAEAEAGHEERLEVLLNLLGQRRTEGNKNIIALEFK
jgi:general secretion pathway protein N